MVIIKGIYCIENKINKKKYIGQSINIEKRWKQHISELRRGKHYNKFLQRAWNKYGESNFEFYIVEQLYASPHAMYNILEAYYISEYKSNDNKFGYNLTIGGDGTIGHTFTEEQRKKISEAQIGRKLTDEWKQHISQVHKEKIKNGYKPKTDHFKKFIEEQKISIDCYDKNGNYIDTYESIQKAGRILNLEATNICKVLKRKHSNIKGYVFYYSNDIKPDKLEIFLRCSRCPIILFDKNKNEIMKFHDAKECAEYVGIDRSCISHACKKENLIQNKYYCKYFYDLYPEEKIKYNR